MCTSRESAERRHNKASKICQGVLYNFIKHGFFLFRAYLDLFIDFMFSFFWNETNKSVPKLEKKHNMLTKSAVNLAAMIRRRELKSEELVSACIERIKAVNPILNAVIDERFDAALKDAKEVDMIIEKGLPEDYFKSKPFLGVPFTAKESHAVKDMINSLGIIARKHVRAREDAECVRLMRAAGAIPLAVTNVPEINKWQESRNMLLGQTNNPYHTGRTVGGSSGGEAALSAAFASPISLCSDIGGSTRMPGFFCGLFAHNPTAGHTSLKGSVLRTGEDPTMASVGFVSKHCSDLGPLTKLVAGDMAPQLDLDKPVDIRNVKYYFVETAQDLRVSPIVPELRKAMSKVIEKLSEEAPSSDKVPQAYYHKGFNHMFALWKYWMTKETDDFAQLLTNNQGRANGLIELAKKIFGLSAYTSAAILYLLNEQFLPSPDAKWAQELTSQMREELTTILGQNGVLLLPSAPAPAPYHYSLLLRPFNFAYWGICNVLKFPATQIPLGLDSKGIPLGMQVVAGPRQDALCLAVADHIAKLCGGGFVPPCTIAE